MYWTVPPMWKGRTVAVLASGESMSQAVADSVRHLPRITVNTTYQLARDADIVYAGDATWWANHPQALECPGIKVTIEPVKRIRPNVPGGVMILRNTGRHGCDSDPSALRTINNSGGQAIQIAAHAGAARILLFGFDMHSGHWHGDHPEGLANPTPKVFAKMLSHFPSLARDMMARNISIINCTPGSLLDCFPRGDIELAA